MRLRMSMTLGRVGGASLGAADNLILAAYDDFNRADENVGADANWTTVGGGFIVESNVVSMNDSAGVATETWAGTGAFAADQFAQATVTQIILSGATNIGVTCRRTSGSDGVNFVMKTNEYRLEKEISGSFTSLDAQVNPQVGDVMRLEVIGDTAYGYVNDELLLTQDVSDVPASTDAGLFGFASGTVNCSIDNWSAGNIVSYNVGRTNVAQDDFNRANEQLDASADWTTTRGTAGNLDVVSNQVEVTLANNAVAAEWAGSGSFGADQYAKFTLKVVPDGSSSVGVRLRGDGSTTGYNVLFDASGVKVEREVSASFTTIDTVAFTPQVGDVLEGRVVGDRVQAILNGRLISDSEDTNIASGQPGVAAYGANDGVAIPTIDNWSAGNIVDDPYTAEIAVDHFTRANEDLDASDNWLLARGSFSNTLRIESNELDGSNNNNGASYVWDGSEVFEDNQYAKVTITRVQDSGSNQGVTLRRSTNNGYNIVIEGTGGTGAKIEEESAGSFTTLDTYAYTPSAGDVIEGRVIGDKIEGYINGELVLSATDTTHTSGQPGIHSFGAASATITGKMDDWSAGNLG